MQPFRDLPRPRGPQSAFSVTEMLISVTLMGVIVIALYSVFNVTQKALRASVTQVDVMDAGRAAMDVLSRDLEQLVYYSRANGTNLLAELLPANVPAVIQDDANGVPIQTNTLHSLFLLSKLNKEWIGTGYIVMSQNTNGVPILPPNGIGTLYRYSTNIHASRLPSNNVVRPFLNVRTEAYNATPGLRADTASGRLLLDSLRRVGDGIVHLRLRAYDDTGRPYLFGYPNNLYIKSDPYQIIGASERIWKGARTNADPNNIEIRRQNRQTAKSETVQETEFLFMSNALPASVEIELGVLEPEALKQYLAMRDSPSDVANSFLRKQAGKVHVFRKRIPIRANPQ